MLKVSEREKRESKIASFISVFLIRFLCRKFGNVFLDTGKEKLILLLMCLAATDWLVVLLWQIVEGYCGCEELLKS